MYRQITVIHKNYLNAVSLVFVLHIHPCSTAEDLLSTSTGVFLFNRGRLSKDNRGSILIHYARRSPKLVHPPSVNLPGTDIKSRSPLMADVVLADIYAVDARY